MENKEAMMLSCLIDSGKGYLFSLHDRKIIFKAMESYSASQNEELRKENEELKRSILVGLKKEGELQSSIEELEKAFENNKEQFMELATHARDLESTIDELKKENIQLIEQLNGKSIAFELSEDQLEKSNAACEQYSKELKEANDTIIQLKKFAENREQ